jgi:hypothetical protein
MYFTTIKQLLVYYYRIVYYNDGHFTRAQPEQTLPGDVIQLIAQQIQAIDKIIEALNIKNKKEAELALKHAIRRFYFALIYYIIGSVPFESPVLSFCAILNRKVRGKDRGL